MGLKWAKIAKIIILSVKVLFFGSNGPKTIRKQLYRVFNDYGGLKLPFSGQTCHFLALKMADFKPFRPSRPPILTKFPPNWPHMLLGHGLGPHWHLLGGPGL